jgi:hypothetical protein
MAKGEPLFSLPRQSPHGPARSAAEMRGRETSHPLWPWCQLSRVATARAGAMSLPITSPTGQGMGAPVELRRATRYRLKASAVYWWNSADGTLQQAQGTTRDISDRGAFVVSRRLPPLGGHVGVDVFLPAVSDATRSVQLHGEGTVLRISGPGAKEPGFALTVVFHTESSDSTTFLTLRRIQ